MSTRRVGVSVARVRELDNVRNFLTSSAMTLVVDTIFTFVFLGVMAYYSVTLTAIVLISLPLCVGLSAAVTPVFRARIQEKFRAGAENQSFLVEAVSGIETVKSLGAEPHIERRWEEGLAAYVGTAFAGRHPAWRQRGAHRRCRGPGRWHRLPWSVRVRAGRILTGTGRRGLGGSHACGRAIPCGGARRFFGFRTRGAGVRNDDADRALHRQVVLLRLIKRRGDE